MEHNAKLEQLQQEQTPEPLNPPSDYARLQQIAEDASLDTSALDPGTTAQVRTLQTFAVLDENMREVQDSGKALSQIMEDYDAELPDTFADTDQWRQVQERQQAFAETLAQIEKDRSELENILKEYAELEMEPGLEPEELQEKRAELDRQSNTAVIKLNSSLSAGMEQSGDLGRTYKNFGESLDEIYPGEYDNILYLGEEAHKKADKCYESALATQQIVREASPYISAGLAQTIEQEITPEQKKELERELTIEQPEPYLGL